MSVDYYKVLNIARTASNSEIKKAYRLMAMKFHPDRHKTNKEAASAKFSAISVAYQTLNSATLKSNYDDLIGNRSYDWQRKQYVRTKSPQSSKDKGPVLKEHFDVKLWNVWHYGDEPEKHAAFSAPTKQRQWGSNPLKDSYEYNNDTAHHYYRANNREREAAEFRNKVHFRGGARFDALTIDQQTAASSTPPPYSDAKSNYYTSWDAELNVK